MKREIKPGEFHNKVGLLERLKQVISRNKYTPKLEYTESLTEMFKEFQNKIYNPQSVFYPSCGFDASASRVFDNVTFLDSEAEGNQGCIKLMRKAGFKAVMRDVLDYKPEEAHDLLILLNPHIPSEWATPYLVRGGYAIANNYHGNAQQLNETPEFNLLAGLNYKDKKAEVLRDLEGYFQPVKNVEELLRLRPEYHRFLQGMFESLAINSPSFNANGSFDEVWARYRSFMKEGFPSRRVANLYVFRKK